MKSKISPYSKAIAGAVVGLATSLAAALADSHVTEQEGLGIVVATVVGSGLVYVAPRNADGGR